jgi:hypothetical protein
MVTYTKRWVRYILIASSVTLYHRWTSQVIFQLLQLYETKT